jgi:hypothetical protein
MSALKKLSPKQAEKWRREWLEALDRLLDDVTAWASEQGWEVLREPHPVSETRLGQYEASRLHIKTPRGELFLEPRGHDFLSDDGWVRFSAYPSGYRVLLTGGRGGLWEIRTERGPKWPHPWGPETFVELAEALLDAA